MKYNYGVAILILLMAFATAATADEVKNLVETCDGCHGANGVSEWKDMPTIAGIDEFVHSEALFIYRDAARPCRDSKFRRGDTGRAATNMCKLVQNMSDEMIEEIAAHYASLPFVAAVQDFDAGLASAGKSIHDGRCELCHTSGGSNAADEASILAGQWTGYLERTFEEYRSGERDQPPRMKKEMDDLTKEDERALLHYYASQQ